MEIAQQASTTEVATTVVPITFTSNGRTFTSSQTQTRSFVVPVTSTPGFGGNGNGQQALGSSGKNVGAIAGGAIGGIIAISFLGALVFCLLRRRRRARQEMDVATHMDLPYPDPFRPSPGTGWDVERASNRSSSTSASSGPFIRPMSQSGSQLTVHRKPVPGMISVPTVSQDPFWDPTQRLDHVPIIPPKARQVQPEDTLANPFVDPPPYTLTTNEASSGEGGGPSRLSTLSDAPSQSSIAVPVS